MGDRSRPVLGLAVVVGAMLLSGCRSSSSTTSTPASPATQSTAGTATKAEFIAQAEAICRSLSAAEKPLEAQQAALKGEATATSGGAFVTIARKVVALSRATDAKLHALPRPPADARAIDTLLASFTEDVNFANELAQAAAKQESSIGEAAERGLRNSISRNAQLADAYGMKVCTGTG